MVMLENKIKIIIADDHQLFREGLVSLFNYINDVEVLAEARDGDELIQLFLSLQPDMAVVDISMPKLSGIEAFKQVRKVIPNAKFLFLTMFDSPEYIHYCRKIGALGLIGKNATKDEVDHAIREVMKGKEYFGREWTPEKLADLKSRFRNLADGVIDPNIALTKMEKRVLYFIGEGYTSIEMADELGISKRTVDSHRSNLMKKVKANSVSQLIAYAIKFNNLADKKSK
jgi:two-component system response regulator NreC